MPSYVALIRGIGPGDPRKSNESLRGVLTELGFGGVRSVISSGNVLFEADSTDTDALGDHIEAAWPLRRGFSATTVVRSREQLVEVLAGNPFAAEPHGPQTYQLVTFFKHPTELGVALPYRPQDAPFVVDGYRHGAQFSLTDTTSAGGLDVMGWIERSFGKQNTSRTPRTVQRIIDRLGD